MKKILVMLVLVSVTVDAANAQTHKTKKGRYDNNYSVCTNREGNYVCTDAQMSRQNKTYQQKPTPAEVHTQVIDMTSSYNTAPMYSLISSYKYHNFIMGDEMDNPANGKLSQQYDGPAKNAERNMNYNQTSVTLKSSDGK